jgi:hypothetical protein
LVLSARTYNEEHKKASDEVAQEKLKEILQNLVDKVNEIVV